MAKQISMESINPPMTELARAGVSVERSSDGKTERITAAGIGTVTMNEMAMSQFKRHMIVNDAGRVDALVFVRGDNETNEATTVA